MQDMQTDSSPSRITLLPRYTQHNDVSLLCVYVCVCVCAHVCMCVTWRRICVCMCLCVYMYVCLYLSCMSMQHAPTRKAFVPCVVRRSLMFVITSNRLYNDTLFLSLSVLLSCCYFSSKLLFITIKWNSSLCIMFMKGMQFKMLESIVLSTNIRFIKSP